MKKLLLLSLSLVFLNLLPVSIVVKVGQNGKHEALGESDRKNWPKIYDILLTYGWPSCLSHLDKISDTDKRVLFQPNFAGQEITFINRKLKLKKELAQYRVMWIPTLVFNALCTKRYFSEYSMPVSEKESIDCSEAFDKNFDSEYMETKSSNFYAQFSNVNKATQSQYFNAHKATGKFLHNTEIIDKKTATKDINWASHYKTIRNDIEQLKNRNIDKPSPTLDKAAMEVYQRLMGQDAKPPANVLKGLRKNVYKKFINQWLTSFNFSEELVKKFIEVDIEGYKKNMGLLFRGTKGRLVDGLFLVDNLKMRNSLSLSNSPLSGSLGERGGGISAGAYIIDSPLGIAVFVDKRKSAGLSEKYTDKLFFISTFNPLVDIFAKGHFSHSRTLVVFEQLKPKKLRKQKNVRGFFGDGTFFDYGAILQGATIWTENSLWLRVNNFEAYRADFFKYLANNIRFVKHDTKKVPQSKKQLIENLKKASQIPAQKR